MVKRREPQASGSALNRRHPTPEEIESFASGADGGIAATPQESKEPLDPHSKRTYKAIRVPFNEYEYTMLEETAQKTGRSKLNLIRWAILKLADETKKNTN